MNSKFFGSCIFALALCATSGCGGDDEQQASKVTQATQIDCSYVKCAIPLCAEGQHLVTHGNTCCPVCTSGGSKKPDCAAVLCAAVQCPDGQQPIVVPGQCCPRCR